METIKLFTKILFFVTLLFVSINESNAQKLNISNGAYFNICKNGNVTIPGDVNLGKGTSGILTMNGDLLKVTGNFNINSGAEFKITQGTLNIATTNYNSNSTVTYNGNNQTVLNHNYGNLAFNGTGTMQISGDAITPTTCNNLTIANTGNNVNVGENKALTVNGTLTNNSGNSGIVIASSATGDGSLISSTANVDGTIKRYCVGTQWHYISTPLSDAQSSMFPAGYFLYWNASAEWAGLGDYTPWNSYTDTYLTPGQGYAYFSSGDVVSFEGKMNVSDYTQTLHKNSGGLNNNQGWNLIGNPYTSAIDWDAAVADGAVPVGAENAIYFFDDDNGTAEQSNYRYYVPSSGGTYGVGTENATKNIPVGQAFFVKTNTDNVTLNIKNSYRLHNNQEYYKSEQEGILNLKVVGNDKSDETILRIVNDATFDFDGNFDARKLFSANTNYPQIYSLSSDLQNYIAINSIPNINEEKIIPLGFKAIEGDYTINVKELSISANYIYLMDTYTNKRTYLNNTDTYSFSYEGGITNDRFYIFICNNDIVAPVPDIENLANLSAECSITPEIPTATDNCNGNITAYTETEFPIFETTTIVWIYEDENGNISTQNQNVNIIDDEKPMLVCPNNKSVTADSTNTYTVQNNELDPIFLDDNCSIKNITNNINSLNTLSGVIFPVGKTKITWTATDGSDNQTIKSFYLTVNLPLTNDDINNLQINVFPNPTSDKFYITGIEKGTIITITDISGKTLKRITSSKNVEIIDIEDYANGMYLISTFNNNTTTVKKIIKK